ncbi:hypothetical protein JFK97_05855 [Chromobacterium phragmitis]|uniref:hypothetical protein n=1 Tax=Chromobacterium amazonense TaxID=1382803 RepID=UPI0021B75E2E|nr:hypothetical protein [Chromobacterium amazonense]MBM2883909.1 hypothetical protein [Chromobacterium amazonense]MDE1711826.1 hypothetical protein [Chromobacterium amazonense]
MKKAYAAHLRDVTKDVKGSGVDNSTSVVKFNKERMSEALAAETRSLAQGLSREEKRQAFLKFAK